MTLNCVSDNQSYSRCYKQNWFEFPSVALSYNELYIVDMPTSVTTCMSVTPTTQTSSAQGLPVELGEDAKLNSEPDSTKQVTPTSFDDLHTLVCAF